MALPIGVLMGLGKGIKKWWKKRRLKLFTRLTDGIEHELASLLLKHGHTLVQKVGEGLGPMVADGKLTQEQFQTVMAKLQSELLTQTPEWADSVVDRLRTKLRIPDDD